MIQHEHVDRDRLLDRVQHYARAAGASPSSISSMVDMLTSPLGTAVLQLDTGAVLTSQLNNDLYKIAMQSMYAQYMTGVTADFALNVRKCPRLAPSHAAPAPATNSSSTSSSGTSSSGTSSSGTSSSGNSTDIEDIKASGHANSTHSSNNGSNGRSGGGSSSSSSSSVLSPGAYVLADIRQQYPDIFSELVARTSQELQTLQPFTPEVLEALQELNGYTPPQALIDRLSAAGVAPVEWIDIEGVPVAVGSGPIEAASNTETSVMQAVQAAIIAAAAQQARDTLCTDTHTPIPSGGIDSSGSSSGSVCCIHTTSTPSATSTPTQTATSSSSSSSSKQGYGMVLDRTEWLASSLGKMVMTVQQLNEMGHGLSIMLMAGRRSTDLLHLMLQNLYFMQHVQGYIGTSSLLVASTLPRLMQQQGMGTAQRQHLCGRIMGTHAHEMTSMTQQLLAGFDAEAGRRCGLKAPVCISQLLAHILFITANGTPSNSSSSSSSSSSTCFAHGTALPDTFTTPYFVGLAAQLDIPPEFVEDMQSKWGVELEPSSKVFDLFSTWRLDSGDYVKMAQLIYDAWQARNTERQGAGLPPLPPLTLLHSNISTLDDIRQLTQLPPHIRPAMVGFGGLADGFMPFDTPAHPDSSSSSTSALHTASAPAEGSGVPEPTSAEPAAVGQGNATAAAPAGPAEAIKTGAAPTAATAAAAGPSKPVTLPVASLVMKAVQARLPAHITNSSKCACNPGDNTARATAAAAGLASSLRALDLTPPTAQTQASAAAPTAAAAAQVLLSVAQPSAVKVGDGSLSKAQLDPRLTAAQQRGVLEGLMQQVEQAQQLQWDKQVQQGQQGQQKSGGDSLVSSTRGGAAEGQQSSSGASSVHQLVAAGGVDRSQAVSEGLGQGGGGGGGSVVQVLSGVLRQAYVAVVREGVLMEAPAVQL